MDKILFLVSFGNTRCIVWALGREDAKRQAFSWIGAKSDHYEVTPLTEKGDRVHIGLTLYV